MSQNTSAFRYDINTLRAIAVLGVLLFHFKIPYAGGGFAGVDIFFVISGYLMSRIVLNGMSKDNFSILDFYKRRALRIIPALLMLVTIVTFVTFFIYLPADYKDVTKNGLSSLLFISNIDYSKVDYFALSSDNNIFLHTWSLSVEWQFYLILPVVLVLINRYFRNDRNRFLLLFVFASISSFAYSVYLSNHNPSVSFYFLHTRAWEMMLGGIAFLCEDKIKFRFKSTVASIGYFILVSSIVLLREDMRWPGLYTLIPTVATFVIILCNQNSFSILKFRIVQFIGRTSYSIYLWHWPFYVFAGYFALYSIAFAPLIFLLISIALGYASYYLIEKYNYANVIKIIVPTLGVAAVLFIVNKRNFNDKLFEKETIHISNYKKNHSAEVGKLLTRECAINFDNGEKPDFGSKLCYGVVDGMKNVMLIGDSHSAHISQSFRERFLSDSTHLIQASFVGCMPILIKNGNQACSEAIDYMYANFIPMNKNKIDAVIISANWINAKRKKQLVSDIINTIKYIESFDIPVIILGQSETYITSYSSIAARQIEYKTSFYKKFIDQESHQVNQALKKSLGSYYIDIFEVNTDKLAKDNTPYMYDHNHYTKYGADFVTNLIFKSQAFSPILND
jgi:peptidoglycan/LPS O-acetylase OafA/YrhL